MRLIVVALTLALGALLGAGCGGGERAQAFDPLLSQPGGRIAFVSDRDGATELYVMYADGSAQTRLTFDGARKDEIAISPDGGTIAFISDRTGPWQIYTLSTIDGGRRQLTTEARNHWRPSFSADGSRLVYFTSYGDGNDEICVMNAAGGGQTRLTDNAAMDVLPVFTPGGRILFASNRDGRFQLYEMDADGENVTRLTTDDETTLYHDVSDDDTYLAVTSGGWLVANAAGPGMFGFVAGGRILLLDRAGVPVRVLADEGDSDKPVFNPAGDAIAFSGNRDGAWQIYTVALDGSGLTPLTTVGNNWFPAWAQ